MEKAGASIILITFLIALLVPRPSDFDCLQYGKMEGEGLGSLIIQSVAQTA